MKDTVLIVLLGMFVAGVFGIGYFAKGNGYLMVIAVVLAVLSMMYAYFHA